MGAITISLDFMYIVGILYLFKHQFTKNYEIVFHPYLRNKTLLILASSTTIIKFMHILYGEQTLYSSSFDFLLILTTIVFFKLRRQYKVRVSLGYLDGVESFIDIPTTYYISIASGVMDRGIKSKNHLITPKEIVFTPYLEKIDFKKWEVILVFFEENAKFENHYHSVIERITIVEGSAYCLTKNDLLETGEFIEIPEKKNHIFYGVTKGAAIIQLEKKPRLFKIL